MTEEALKAESPKTGRMNLVFHRGEKGVDSKAASRNGFGKALNLVETTSVMLGQGPDFAPQFVEMLKRNEDLKSRILKLLKNCDFEISDIAIGETKLSEEILSSFPLPAELKQALAANGGATFSTLHAISDDELSIVGMGAMDFWTQESNGTRKFFEMAVPIVSALDNGHTLYLDEYGTYLHPNLAQEQTKRIMEPAI